MVIPDCIIVATVPYGLNQAEEDRIEKAVGIGRLATSLPPEKILISHCSQSRPVVTVMAPMKFRQTE